MKAARHWDVYTDANSERGGLDFLGCYYGTVATLALRLAHLQRGFWCDGKLTFKPASAPGKLPKKIGKKVNVVVEGHDWVAPSTLKKAKAYFAGANVIVEECNLYGAVTIRPKPKKK